MRGRDLTEANLSQMLHATTAIRPDGVEGRWVVEAQLRRRRWEIIVEPDATEYVIVAITA